MVQRKFKVSILFLIFAIMFCFQFNKPLTKTYAETSQTISNPQSANISMQMYNPQLDSGFVLANPVTSTVFGSTAYTSLSIVTDGDLATSSHNGFQAFGVTGTTTSLEFKINHLANIGEPINNSSEWLLSDDNWGKSSSQKVNGVLTGEVDSGALVIQTSYDGVTWSTDNKAAYTNGLFTTNYYAYYQTSKQIIYIPSGNDISKGIYIRVIYAYEVYDYVKCEHKSLWDKIFNNDNYRHDNHNVYTNYVEEYSFYLCFNSPTGVTFHNLSLEGKIDEGFNEEMTSMEINKQAETLINNSITTTGFKIDKSLNQTATINIKKDHLDFSIPTNNEVRENGRYDITVTTQFGNQSTTTIFVFSKTKEELYSLYFGEHFIAGKRIYTEDQIPTFEGGFTTCYLQAINDIIPAISGSIVNKSTNHSIPIQSTSNMQEFLLTEAGEYEIKLNTNSTFTNEIFAGDNHCIVFKFKLIAQGTAPGPQINKKSLQNFSQLVCPSNLHSTYYGITFQSASRGYITLAFSTKEAAFEYAYNYEKGMVEIQSDGTFRYNGSLQVSQKTKYESGWDLTDAINFFAEQAIQKLHFDLRDEFTYLTLNDSDISNIKNLRTLELEKSVILLANDTEKDNLIKSGNLPIINTKKLATLTIGEGGQTVRKNQGFEFVKDTNGYDSNSVNIIDCNNNRFEILYNTPVGEQLALLNCATGIITIEEKTIYGDTSTYEAVYIKDSDNTSNTSVKYIDNKVSKTITLDQTNNNDIVNADAFSINSVIDNLDPYGSIILKLPNNEIEVYCLDEIKNKSYTSSGQYTITLLNRLGHSYSFKITIAEEIYFSTEIIYGGDVGSEFHLLSDNDILTLPQLSKYGYNFNGYRNSNGDIFSAEVQAILLKGSSILEPVWEAKKFKLQYIVGQDIQNEETITFGKSYTLPKLQSSSTEKFVGWKNSLGALVNTLNIDTEGDIRLYAHFEAIEPTQDTAPQNKKSIKVWQIIILLLAAGISIVIAGLVIYNSIMSDGGLVWLLVISIPSAIALMFISMAWWIMLLIEQAIIWGIVIITAIIEEY